MWNDKTFSYNAFLENKCRKITDQSWLVDFPTLAIHESPNKVWEKIQPIGVNKEKESRLGDYSDKYGIHYNIQLKKEFYSEKNILQIQNDLINRVYKASCNRYIIPKQNKDMLLNIMPFFYQTYGYDNPTNIDEQIKRINKIMIDSIMPDVIANIEMQLDYISNKLDKDGLPTIPDYSLLYPINVNMKGSKVKLSRSFS